MPTFNAGAIEGKLTLGRDPFTEGLRLAREQAAEFEANKINATVSVDSGDVPTRLAELTAELDALAARTPVITPELRTAEFEAKLAALTAEIDRLDGRTIDINTKQATSQVGELEKAVKGGGGSGGSGGGGLLGALGMPGLLGILTALSPLIDPLAGEVLGLGGAFTVAGVGIGAFALPAVKDFKDMKSAIDDQTKAQQELNAATTDQQKVKALNDLAAAQAKLTGPLGAAAASYQQVTKAFSDLVTATAGPVFNVISGGLKDIAEVVPMLTPVVVATANALNSAVDQIQQLIDSPAFAKFLSFVSGNIGSVLSGPNGLIGSLLSVGQGFMQLVVQTNPLIQGLLLQVNQLATGFVNLANNPAMTQFINFIASNMPLVTQLFTVLFDLLGHIMVGLEPAVAPLLNFIIVLGQGLDQIVQSGALAQFAGLFGDLLDALAPLLPLAATLISDLLPPLIQLVDAVVKQGLGPLVIALVQNLIPQMPALVDGFTQFTQALIPLIPLLTGPMVSFIVVAATALGDLGQAVGFLAPLLGPLAVGWGLWNIALGISNVLLDMSPVGWIVIAIAALAIGIVELVKHWDDVTAALKKFWDIIKNAFDAVLGLGPKVANWFKEAGGAIEDFGKKAVQWLEKTGELLLHGFIEGIEKGAQAVWDFLKALPGRIAYGMAFAAGFLVKSGIELIAGYVEGNIIAAEAIWDFFKKLPGRIKSYVEDAIHWLEGTGKDTGTGLFNGITNAAESVWGWFRDLPGRILSFLVGAGNWLLNVGSDILSGLWHGIQSGASTVADFFSGLPGRVVGAMGDAKTWLVQVGKDAITGLWNGIWSMVDWIGNKIAGFTGDIVNGFKHGFDSHSPSRVMADEVGQWIPAGIAQGMLANQQPIKDATKALVGAALVNANTVRSVAASGAQNLALGPNSMPALAAPAPANDNTDIAALLQELIDELKRQPQAIGDATAEGVAGKFEDALTKQNKDQQVRARQGGGR